MCVNKGGKGGRRGGGNTGKKKKKEPSSLEIGNFTASIFMRSLRRQMSALSSALRNINKEGEGEIKRAGGGEWGKRRGKGKGQRGERGRGGEIGKGGNKMGRGKCAVGVF